MPCRCALLKPVYRSISSSSLRDIKFTSGPRCGRVRARRAKAKLHCVTGPAASRHISVGLRPSPCNAVELWSCTRAPSYWHCFQWAEPVFYWLNWVASATRALLRMIPVNPQPRTDWTVAGGGLSWKFTVPCGTQPSWTSAWWTTTKLGIFHHLHYYPGHCRSMGVAALTIIC